ncbi:MAG: hypothetical protein ACE5H2_06150 [Terriglobia bacterium]
MAACAHPAAQERRSVYYLLCGACTAVRIVTYCNYSQDCHPQCSLADVCVQPARNRYHASIPLRVDPALLDAARARQETRTTPD